MMTSLQCAESPGRRLGELDVTPGELAGIVLTAIGANAFTYGFILHLNGATDVMTMAVLAGGGLLGLVAAVYLVVVYEIRAIVGG